VKEINTIPLPVLTSNFSLWLNNAYIKYFILLCADVIAGNWLIPLLVMASIRKTDWLTDCAYNEFSLFNAEENKLYPLTHHTWKMSPHCLVKCKTFTSDCRQCCIPPNVGDCEKSRLWVGISGFENDWPKRWKVAIEYGYTDNRKHMNNSK